MVVTSPFPSWEDLSVDPWSYTGLVVWPPEQTVVHPNPSPSNPPPKAKANPAEAAHPMTPIPIAPQTVAVAQTPSYTDGDALVSTKANEILATVTL